MTQSWQISRIKQLLENDRTGMTVENLSIISSDIESVIDDYFERKDKPTVRLIETDGEYKLSIEVVVNNFKSFNSIK